MTAAINIGKRVIAGLLGLVVLTGCATPPMSASLLQQVPAEFSAPVVIPGVPFFAQDQYECGPAALATVLAASGVSVVPDDLVPLIYVPERKGSFQVEIVAAARSYVFAPGKQTGLTRANITDDR